eukprot:scaffold225_cov267-Pavlova_lutheri.AAC.1
MSGSCLGFTTQEACASACQSLHQQLGYELGQQGLCVQERCQNCGQSPPPSAPSLEPVTDCLGKTYHDACREECMDNYAAYGFGASGSCIFEACGSHRCETPPTPPGDDSGGDDGKFPWLWVGIGGGAFLFL